MRFLFRPMTFLSVLLLLAACGCEETSIQTYSAPKTKPLIDGAAGPASSAPATPTRMLAAILPLEKETWFFKLTGDPATVAELVEPFGLFVASTRFVGEVPEWDVPADWKEQRGKPMRFTTYIIGKSGIELSISTLPSGADKNEALLANVNRWRGQLGLPGLTMDNFLARDLPEADSELVEMHPEAGTVLLVDFTGKMASSGSSPPFANMGNHPPIDNLPQRSPATTSNAPGELKYDQPESWTSGKLNSMRLAAFEARAGNEMAEITVSTAGGDLLSNINRWRGQVGLDSWSAEVMQQNTMPLEAGQIPVQYVRLLGPSNAILGAIFEQGGRTWFVKLTGPTELAKQEIKNFEDFVRSIRFE